MYSCGKGSLAFIAGGASAGGFDLAAQGATDQFGKSQVLAPRFAGQNFLDLSWYAERHRCTAFGQLRSGHEICVLLHHTPCQPGIFLPRHIAYDTVGGRASQGIEVLYKEAEWRPSSE